MAAETTQIDSTTHAHLTKAEVAYLREACDAMKNAGGGDNFKSFAARPKLAREVIDIWCLNSPNGFLTIMRRRAQAETF